MDLCTYFDHRYLPRGLALYDSLRQCRVEFRLWVLCLSDECYRALTSLALPGIVPLPLSAIEEADPALAASKADRSAIEYYFTCTPALMSWLFASQPDIDVLTYVDSDLYFYSHPGFLLEDFKDYATAIVPHGFSERNAQCLQWGIYNVGWVSFRRSPDGLACLAWWRQVCLEWCRDFIDGGRFADQKYLDEFPTRFRGVRIIEHPGVNLAPWNLDSRTLTRSADGRLLVNGRPLVFFHFHGLRKAGPLLWKTVHPAYGAPLGGNIRCWLYRPYIAVLRAGEKRAARYATATAPLARIGVPVSITTLLDRFRRLWRAVKGGGVIISR